jgi:acetyl esterase/lipase
MYRLLLRLGLALLGSVALPGFAATQTNAPAATPPAATDPLKGVTYIDNVVLGKGGGRDIIAEVAYPTYAPRPMPAVLFIHGGGWAYGNPRPVHMPNGVIANLARKGYFAVYVGYRLSGEAKWPAQIEDCELSVRWLRANAKKYGVDPNRIGAWGMSAGGHLVDCMATMADVKEYQGDGGYAGVSSAVQVAVHWFGATDFTDPQVQTHSGGSIEPLMGMPYAQNPEAWKKASPAFYVKKSDPPILIIHGEEDQFLPVSQAKIFDAALTKVGATHTLVLVKNGMHGFSPVPGKITDPSMAEIQKLTDDFLAKYLKSR